jgi:hypothetical protein
MAGFIDHLYTRLGTTSIYSATANLHNSQITTAPNKSFPACYVFTFRSLATAPNSGDSSASRAQVLSSPTLVQNCLPAVSSTELDLHLFSASLAELNCPQHSTLSLNHLCTKVKVKVKVEVTLRLAVYRQSVRLGVKPLETHGQTFFFSTELLR